MLSSSLGVIYETPGQKERSLTFTLNQRMSEEIAILSNIKTLTDWAKNKDRITLFLIEIDHYDLSKNAKANAGVVYLSHVAGFWRRMSFALRQQELEAKEIKHGLSSTEVIDLEEARSKSVGLNSKGVTNERIIEEFEHVSKLMDRYSNLE